MTTSLRLVLLALTTLALASLVTCGSRQRGANAYEVRSCFFGLGPCETTAALRVCWRGLERPAEYCPAGAVAAWPVGRLPLRLWVDVGEGRDQAVRDAAKALEREVGRELFVPAAPWERADVSVVRGDATAGGAGATQHYGTAGPDRARVELRQVACQLEAYWVAEHELGHVLGLQDNRRGVMGPMPADLCTRASLSWMLPTDAEIELLKQMY